MSFNAYLYSSNTPINMIDSDGRAGINIVCAIIGSLLGWHFGDTIAKMLGYRSGWKYNLIRAGVVVGGAVIGWFAGKYITKVVSNYFRKNISKIANMAASSPRKLKIISSFFGVNPFKTSNSGKFLQIASKIASKRYVSDLKWAKQFYQAAKDFGYSLELHKEHGGYTFHMHLFKKNGIKLSKLHFEITKGAYNYLKKFFK